MDLRHNSSKDLWPHGPGGGGGRPENFSPKKDIRCVVREALGAVFVNFSGGSFDSCSRLNQGFYRGTCWGFAHACSFLNTLFLM